MALPSFAARQAIRLKSGAKRKWLAHAQHVADDPSATLRLLYWAVAQSRFEPLPKCWSDPLRCHILS